MALTDANPAFGRAERNGGAPQVGGRGSAMSGECYWMLGTCFEILEKLLQTVESFGFEIFRLRLMPPTDENR